MTVRRQARAAVWSVIGLVSWITFVVLVTRGAVLLLAQFTTAMMLVLVPFALAAAWGTIIAVSQVGNCVEAWQRGYGVRWLDGPLRAHILGVKYGDRFRWVYEESSPSGDLRQIHFVREIVGRGYPVPSQVCIPNIEDWDREVPSWAVGRRSEVVQRIDEAFGKNTVFVDR